jgi:hypothetical protein
MQETKFQLSKTIFAILFNFFLSTGTRLSQPEEAVNLCSRYVEKSTKYSEQKCASYFRE